MISILFYFNRALNSNKGGVEKITILLGRYFENRNLQTFYLTDEYDEKNECIRNYLLFPEKGGLSKSINQEYLKTIIAKYSIDIIVNQAGIFPSSIPLVRLKGNAKLITVMHNTLDGMYSYPNLPFKHPIFLKFMFSKPFRRIYNVVFYAKYHRFLKYLCTGSDVVILISDKYRDELRKYCGNIATEIVAIPNALTFPRTEYFEKKDKEILFVGRLEWQKRPDLLLNIWKSFSYKHPDWHLTILGDGTYRPILEKRIQEEVIPNVSILGFQDPVPFYKKARALCMTSCYESFGLVLLEAMNYGVIPIAFNTFPNLEEIISDSCDGYIIPPFDIDKYVLFLEDLCFNDSHSSLMRKNAKRKLDMYSINRVGEQWVQLFSQILK